ALVPRARACQQQTVRGDCPRPLHRAGAALHPPLPHVHGIVVASHVLLLPQSIRSLDPSNVCSNTPSTPLAGRDVKPFVHTRSPPVRTGRRARPVGRRARRWHGVGQSSSSSSLVGSISPIRPCS